MADDAKKAILARRAKFVAAAMAALGGEACGKERAAAPAIDAGVPQPCLEVLPPTVCLKIAAPPRDARACDPADPLCGPDPDAPKSK